MSQLHIDRFLKLTADRGASDLHLSSGHAPILRLSGELDSVRYRLLDEEEIARLVKPITPPANWQQFQESGDADFGYELEGLARFRVNLFRQEHGMAAVFRVVPSQIITIEQLGLPGSLKQLERLESGLVLVTGPTGSGKSTTLAAVLDLINRSRAAHIVTIEDPIEFVHLNRKSVISQREVGQHSSSFARALRLALREDPDVVMVGELRDQEVMEIGLQAADAGLLVLSTLHTNTASRTLGRMVSAFPPDRQDGIAKTLAATLRAVVSQQLLPRLGGGRVAAAEVLLDTPALASAIRDGKTYKIPDIIRGGSERGMVLMDDAVRRLVEEGLVAPSVAYERAYGKDRMAKWLQAQGHELPEDVKLADAEKDDSSA